MAPSKQLGRRGAGRKVHRPEAVSPIAKFCGCLPGYINLWQIQWRAICDLIKEAGSRSPPALLNGPELTLQSAPTPQPRTPNLPDVAMLRESCYRLM